MKTRNNSEKMCTVETMMATNMTNDEMAKHSQSDIYKIKKYAKCLHAACSESKQKLIEINEFTKRYFDFQMLSNGSLKESVTPIIEFGTMMLVQKKLVLSLGLDWEEWVASNYQMNMTTVKNYMKMARVPSITNYYPLGVERLIDLAEMVISIHGDDFDDIENPIAELFSNAGIILLTREHMEEDKFDEEVDQLILSYKISAAVIDQDNFTMIIDQSLLLKAVKQSKNAIGRQEIKQMIAIKQSGGDPNAYLQDGYGQQELRQTA